MGRQVEKRDQLIKNFVTSFVPSESDQEVVLSFVCIIILHITTEGDLVGPSLPKRRKHPSNISCSSTNSSPVFSQIYIPNARSLVSIHPSPLSFSYPSSPLQHLQHGKQNTNSTDHNRAEAESFLSSSTKWYRQRRCRKRSSRIISIRRRRISAAWDRSRVARRRCQSQTNRRNRRRCRRSTITSRPSRSLTSAWTRGNRHSDRRLAVGVRVGGRRGLFLVCASACWRWWRRLPVGGGLVTVTSWGAPSPFLSGCWPPLFVGEDDGSGEQGADEYGE